MNATTQFPWAMVVSNAVWICGLAVILAAFGWYDYKRRERKERSLKAAATTNEAAESSDVAAGFSLRSGEPSSFRRDSFKKPVLLGLIMVAGGLALSVRGTILVAVLAAASFVLIFVFAKKYIVGLDKNM